MANRKLFTLHTDVSKAIVRNSMNAAMGENDIYAYLRDGLLFRWHFETTEDYGQNYIPYPIPPAAALKFMVKNPAAITSSEALISADIDAWNQPGDWAGTNIALGQCCVRASAATAALEAFLSDAGTSMKIGIAEVEMQEPGADPVTLVHFNIGLYNDVIRGTEGAPMAVGPTLATTPYVDHRITQALKPDGGRVDLTRGTMDLWDDELQQWVTYGSKGGQLVRITS
jgi:hypothetical protein